MKTSIQFTCNGQILYGKFYSTAGSSGTFPTLVLLAGFPGNEEDVLGLGEGLAARGLNTLVFNYRGTYRSEGAYSLINTMEDIQAAFDFLQDEKNISKFHIDIDKLLLGGWSYGGGMGLIYAANHPEVRRVFAISGTDHGAFARQYQHNEAFTKLIDEVFEELKYPRGPVRFANEKAIHELTQNSDAYDFLKHTEKLVDRDILLIGGWDDFEVVLENDILPGYRRLRELGAEKVNIRALQDSHRFENCKMELADIIFNWVDSIFEEEKTF